MPIPPDRPALPSPLRFDLLALAACIALFALLPDLDLRVSALLQAADGSFRWAQAPLVQLSYVVFKGRHIGWVLVALLGWLMLLLVRRPRDARRLRQASFLFVLIVAGPLLLVNTGFKDHWGRARPAEVTQFGGERQYSPPLVPAAQCDTNCSFVSSHAAAGFALIGLFWVTRRRRWMVLGILLGGAVGLGRMLQGAHFLSDVVFSFWSVYLCGLLLDWLMLRSLPPGPGTQAARGEAA